MTTTIASGSTDQQGAIRYRSDRQGAVASPWDPAVGQLDEGNLQNAQQVELPMRDGQERELGKQEREKLLGALVELHALSRDLPKLQERRWALIRQAWKAGLRLSFLEGVCRTSATTIYRALDKEGLRDSG